MQRMYQAACITNMARKMRLPNVGSNFCGAQVCKAIFEEQLDGWYRVEGLWSRDRSIAALREWFEYRFHSMPIDLANKALIWEDL